MPNPAQSIAAFERDTPLDRAAFEGLLVARNGVKVLPHARVVTPDMLARAIRTAKAFYPVVIVDMHQGLTPQLIVAKDFATHLLVMTTASERRIPSTVQFVDEVKRYDTPAKLRVIVNRVRDDEEVRRVRAALEDYKTPILTLPFQEGLLIDDDPEFVPIAGSKGKDPVSVGVSAKWPFGRSIGKHRKARSDQRQRKRRPTSRTPRRRKSRGSSRRSLAAVRRRSRRRRGRSGDAQVQSSAESRCAPARRGSLGLRRWDL